MKQNSGLIDELNEKIALLEEIQNINQIGHWELYLDTNKVKWSAMVYDIHELPHNTDLDKTQGISFYHPDYQEIVSKAVENCIINAEPFNIECILITDKKNEKWVRATGRKKGNRLIGSFQDITDIKNQELKFKGIFNSTFTFIGFLDTNGILLEANDTAVNLAGIKHSDVIGKYFWDCYWWQISTKTQQELKANFQRVLSGETLEYEVAVWIANQTPITILFTLKPIFDDNGKVIYVIPEGRPVQELVDTRRRYKSVLEGTNVGTWEWNVQTGETVFNERWAEIVGYTLDELAPISIETWMKLAHPDDLEESNKRLNACFERKSEFYELEARMKHKDGHWVWVYDRGKVFEWTDDGKPLWMYGTHQEITHQKEAEFEIVKSKEQYESLVQNIPGITYRCMYNANWTMLYMSNQVDRITGYSANEMIGDASVSYGELIHSDDQDRVSKAVAGAIASNAPWEIEYRVKHKDGSIRWAYEKGIAIKNDENTVLYLDGFILDITAKKIAQEENKYQQQILNSLYHLSPIGIALNDYETGVFIDCNDKLLEPTGYTKEEFLSLSYWDVTPKEYEKLEAIAIDQMQSSGKYEEFEKEYICKDGSRYPVSLQGVVITDTKGKKLIWSFVRDISKEKEAERKLKEAVAKLQAVLDASKQVSIIATDTQGTITLFNSGAEQMLGYRAEELVGQQTPVLIHLQDEIEKESKVLSEKYEKEINGFDTFVYEAQIGHPNTKEWTYITKDGHLTPVLLSVNKISVGDTITGYLGVATDITELKKVEKEIRSLLSITEEQNHRLKNFAHIVSHNLRSHSFGLSGLLNIFHLEHPDLESNELLLLFDSGIQNLQQTVEDLTEIVKVNLVKEEFQNICISEIIKKNILTLTSQISKSGIKIIDEIPKTIQIKGIPAYMDSIILNMMTNAIKYKSDDREPVLKIYHKEDASTISLFFEDNGLGIDLKKHGDKLFGMYKTFHRHDDSRGVGLFITKNQVESMGGKIAVESEVNVGATFIIIFKK